MDTDLYAAFANAFDTPSVSFLRGQIHEMPSRETAIRALIAHPETPESEREAARRALARITA